MKRVMAEIRTVPKEGEGLSAQPPVVLKCRVILNDFSATGVGIFTTEPIMAGEPVAITLEYPKRFYCKGIIAWSEAIPTTSKVLSEPNYAFRMGIEFTFATPEEEKAVQDFYAELQKEHILPKAAG
jgi:hypothetical protein